MRNPPPDAERSLGNSHLTEEYHDASSPVAQGPGNLRTGLTNTSSEFSGRGPLERISREMFRHILEGIRYILLTDVAPFCRLLDPFFQEAFQLSVPLLAFEVESRASPLPNASFARRAL